MNWRVQGFRAWLAQRVTAVYMGVFIVWMLLHFMFNGPDSYPEWRNWLGSPVIALAVSVFFLATLVHGWVGIRDVVLDYVHPFALRFSLLALIAVALLVAGLWVLRILFLATI